MLDHCSVTGFGQVRSVMVAQRRNRLLAHFSERVPVVQQHMLIPTETLGRGPVISIV